MYPKVAKTACRANKRLNFCVNLRGGPVIQFFHSFQTERNPSFIAGDSYFRRKTSRLSPNFPPNFPEFPDDSHDSLAEILALAGLLRGFALAGGLLLRGGWRRAPFPARSRSKLRNARFLFLNCHAGSMTQVDCQNRGSNFQTAPLPVCPRFPYSLTANKNPLALYELDYEDHHSCYVFNLRLLFLSLLIVAPSPVFSICFPILNTCYKSAPLRDIQMR